MFRLSYRKKTYISDHRDAEYEEEYARDEQRFFLVLTKKKRKRVFECRKEAFHHA